MARIIDLSLPMENFTNMPDQYTQEIIYWDHEEGTRRIGRNLGLSKTDWPDGIALAMERVTALTHSGTHLDAPYHVTPYIKGKKAMTIDEVPLKWCFSDGVVLDLTHKNDGEFITEEDVVNALEKIDYSIKAGDIVLIRTDAYKRFMSPDYFNCGPGMSRDATRYIVGQGVKVMGIDTGGFDRPPKYMLKDYREGIEGSLWPSHFVGRELLHIHMEQMANLDKISVPYGFKVAAFPIKIKKASGAWVRPVAIIDD
jgi:kynurenine formamidase